MGRPFPGDHVNHDTTQAGHSDHRPETAMRSGRPTSADDIVYLTPGAAALRDIDEALKQGKSNRTGQAVVAAGSAGRRPQRGCKAANDSSNCRPMLTQARQCCQANWQCVETLLADNGYFSAANVTACAVAGGTWTR